MFTINISTKKMEEKLNTAVRKQIPFAASLALNNTAKDIKGELEKKIKKVFKQPTPFHSEVRLHIASEKN